MPSVMYLGTVRAPTGWTGEGEGDGGCGFGFGGGFGGVFGGVFGGGFGGGLGFGDIQDRPRLWNPKALHKAFTGTYIQPFSTGCHALKLLPPLRLPCVWLSCVRLSCVRTGMA